VKQLARKTRVRGDLRGHEVEQRAQADQLGAVRRGLLRNGRQGRVAHAFGKSESLKVGLEEAADSVGVAANPELVAFE